MGKAQTTIFMIIGLVVIVGGAILFYTIDVSKEDDLSQAFSETLDVLPTEFEPLRDYVNSCMQTVAEDALRLLGEQGGYISPTTSTYSNVVFSPGSTPTESDVVTYPGGGLNVPYWFYLKSGNRCEGTCNFASNKPTLEDIQNQMNTYISQEIDTCINSFLPFIDQGFEINQKEQPQAVTLIAEEDVVVALMYPLELSRNDARAEIDRFIVHIPVKFKKLYDFASHITDLQQEYRFFEKHALELIVGFSGLESHKLPPFTEYEFTVGSTLQWSEHSVKQKVTQMLSGYSQLFQVEQTKNFHRQLFDTPLQQRLYDATLIPNDENYRDFEASFAYLDFWDLYFDLNCDGDVCKPSSTNTLIPNFGIQQYRFAYDISYPIIVELTHPEAFSNEEYMFRFALESNIRNNKLMPAEFNPLKMAEISGSASSLLCNQEHWMTENVNIVVQDTAFSPVQNAQIQYTIIDDTCFMGQTNENGWLESNFPTGVVGGALIARSLNHIGKTIEFSPQQGSYHTLQLTPIAEKNVIVQKKKLENKGTSWEFNPAAQSLDSREEAMVTLRRIAQEGEEEFSSFAQFIPGQASTMRLAPGTYEADITLVLNDIVIIPEQTKEIQTGLFGTEEIVIPAVDFSSNSPEPEYIAGGLRTTVKITQEMIDRGQTIIFYVVAPDLPQQIEDLEYTQNIDYYSSAYRTALQPSHVDETIII